MKPALVPFLTLFAAGLVPGVAAAQEPLDEELPPGMAPDDEERDYLFDEPADEAPSEPPRIVVSLGGGSSMRVVQDLDFSQDRFAPAFIDAFGAFVFGGPGPWRHGVGLGLGMNLTGDGASQGVDGGGQLVLAPAYLAYFRFGWDLVVFGKVGVPLALNVGSEGMAPGLELSGGASFFLTAGFGVYAEIGGSAWLGGEQTIHPLVSAEAGVTIDYEVLP